jgi:hypothetical protein
MTKRATKKTTKAAPKKVAPKATPKRRAELERRASEPPARPALVIDPVTLCPVEPNP